MASIPWRHEPLGVGQFPLGHGPFRARGLAYSTAVKYVDKRLGGRAAFLDALGKDDPYRPYYDQIFLVTGDYDVSPLVRLFVVAAQLERVPVGRFIEERAKRSAGVDTQGLWKPLFKGTSVEAMAENLHVAFNRYYQPCQARLVSMQKGRYEGELSKVPVCMAGLYVNSTIGFIAGALEVGGGQGLRVEFGRSSPDGDLSRVSLLRVPFTATWR